MNVVPRTFVSPRSCFSVTTVETQPDDFSIKTSAGYSHGAGPVNASDRPQVNKGHSSLGEDALAAEKLATLKAKLPGGADATKQKPCFRLDLTLPYGHVLF